MSSQPLAIMAKRLSRSEIFGDLPEEDLLAIASFCQEESYHEGQAVLVEGEPANQLFVVERGKLALEAEVSLGRHSTRRNATIGYVGSARMAGFSTLSSPHIYSTSAICVEPTRAIVVNGEMLRAYLQENPAAGLKVMDKLTVLIADRYRGATSTLTYFLSIVSHELRGPLAAIENYLRTMLGGFAGDLTAKQERMVKRSILRVTDLNVLIGNVVDLARMRPEQIQVDFELFDPGEVGAESIEDCHLAAAEKEIRIRVEPPPKFEPIVGARRRMRQVFTNLLNNAIKFSSPNTTVTFRAHYEPERLVFEVEDQGPGIPPEDLPHIFKDFFRSASTADTPGTGMGLSIAMKIVEAHEGEILADNVTENGEVIGSRFTVKIPTNLKTAEMHRQEWAAMDQDGMEEF